MKVLIAKFTEKLNNNRNRTKFFKIYDTDSDKSETYTYKDVREYLLDNGHITGLSLNGADFIRTTDYGFGSVKNLADTESPYSKKVLVEYSGYGKGLEFKLVDYQGNVQIVKASELISDMQNGNIIGCKIGKSGNLLIEKSIAYKGEKI